MTYYVIAFLCDVIADFIRKHLMVSGEILPYCEVIMQSDTVHTLCLEEIQNYGYIAGHN